MKRNIARWDVLFIEYLKRDWKLFIGWILGLSVFSGGFVPFFQEISKGAGLIGMYETMKNPAMIALVGPTPVKEAADYTVGAMYGHMMLLFCGLFAMIFSALHVVMHTRREEESGLTEFICAYRVGRYAGSFALMAELLFVHVMLVLCTGALMAAFREETIGVAPSFLFAAAIGAAGLMGGALTLVVAQLMPSATGATGVSLGIVGALYLLRAVTDMSEQKLSMLNPMGWLYLTFPFTKNRVYPLVFCIIFCVVLTVAAFLLEQARDMGAGYLPERAGNGNVKKSLLSVHGLFFRLNRGVMLGWLATLACLGAVYGSIYGDMETFLESNELIRMMFTADGITLEKSFTSVIMVVLAGLAAILPVAVVNRLYAEETGAHLDQLLATKVKRAGIYWTNIMLAVLAAAAGILAGAGGLGGAAVLAMEHSSMDVSDFLAAGMNYFPAVLFMAALAALVLGWLPKLGRLVYVYVTYAMMLNYFQGILDLPEWFARTAVLSWLPRLPLDEFDGAVFAGMTAVSVLMLAAGYLGYRRRDL